MELSTALRGSTHARTYTHTHTQIGHAHTVHEDSHYLKLSLDGSTSPATSHFAQKVRVGGPCGHHKDTRPPLVLTHKDHGEPVLNHGHNISVGGR